MVIVTASPPVSPSVVASILMIQNASVTAGTLLNTSDADWGAVKVAFASWFMSCFRPRVLRWRSLRRHGDHLDRFRPGVLRKGNCLDRLVTRYVNHGDRVSFGQCDVAKTIVRRKRDPIGRGSDRDSCDQLYRLDRAVICVHDTMIDGI